MTLKPNTLLKRIYAYTFLVLFLGYFACVTMFYHTHVVFGETISHSHPYKSSGHGAPAHSHTTEGFITIHLLSSITVILCVFNFKIKPAATFIYEIAFKIKVVLSASAVHYIYLLRAPPSGMLN